MREKILELRKGGKSYNEISEILGCSKSTISYHCSGLKNNKEVTEKLLNIKKLNQIKDKFLIPDVETIKRIYELKISKTTNKDISILLDLSMSVISKVCRSLNIVSYRKFSHLDSESISQMRDLYLKVKSVKKVASMLSIHRTTVSKYVKDIITRKKLSDIELKKVISKSVVSWRKRKKIELVEYKGGCCQICGYKKSVRALEFHHIDPKEKDFTISGKSWSFDRLKKEVDKCVLVCANCHIEIHEGIISLNF